MPAQLLRDVGFLRALVVVGDGVDDVAGVGHLAVEGDVAAIDAERRPVDAAEQVALHDRQVPGQRVPIDVDLMAAGARFGDRLDGDVVVAEDTCTSMPGKQLAEARRNPVDLAPVRAPDDDLAFLLGGFVERLDLRRSCACASRCGRAAPVHAAAMQKIRAQQRRVAMVVPPRARSREGIVRRRRSRIQQLGDLGVALVHDVVAGLEH